VAVNLVPEVENFFITEREFRERGHQDNVQQVADGSVEDGCIGEGLHRVLRFDMYCHNIGDVDLVIGNPEERTDIFEPSVSHRWILKEKLFMYSLRNNSGIERMGYKRPWCLRGGINRTTGISFSCREQGIQAGKRDLYQRGLSCQFVVIDGIADGLYTFEATINPMLPDRTRVFEEDNYDDNTASLLLKIAGEGVSIENPRLNQI
jgi:hypothetical protein